MLTHGSLSLVYDGDGNRVSETVGGTTTKFLVDSLNPTKLPQVMDELLNGSVTRTFAYGRQRISENQLVNSTWVPSFYGYDGHGNVRFLANSAGAITDSYDFDAFGMPIRTSGTTANQFLYSGERYDSNIGLYDLRARYLNQATGRFWSRDPVEHTGCCTHCSRCQSCSAMQINPYAYGNDDPVNRVDPFGREALAEYELNTVTVVGEVTAEKFPYQECVRICEKGCDDVIAENPEINANIDFLILCYTTCPIACRSIFPA